MRSSRLLGNTFAFGIYLQIIRLDKSYEKSPLMEGIPSNGSAGMFEHLRSPIATVLIGWLCAG